jgi:hypothetical protein
MNALARPRGPVFEPGSCDVGFVVDKVAMGQLYSEHYGFFLAHYLTDCPQTHHHHLSSGDSKISQIVVHVPS